MALHHPFAEMTDEKLKEAVETWIKVLVIRGLGGFTEGAIMLSSGSPRFDPYGVDFGWGKLVALSNCRSTLQQCLYQVNYDDGSFPTSDFVTESVSFGNSASRIALGCGHDHKGFFVGATGLLGLGGGPLSLTSQLKMTSFSDLFTREKVERDCRKSIDGLEASASASSSCSVQGVLKKWRV
ncbi:Protein ASPARTIC PROTEASE IN GUARD CELL 1 [Linum perenne]